MRRGEFFLDSPKSAPSLLASGSLSFWANPPIGAVPSDSGSNSEIRNL